MTIVPARDRARSASRATRSRAASPPAASASPSAPATARPPINFADPSRRPRRAASSIRRGCPACSMIPDDKHVTSSARATSSITNDWQAYVHGALLARTRTHFVIQPVPLSSLFSVRPERRHPARRSRCRRRARSIRTRSPPHAGVDGQPLNVRYRAFENGFRDTTDTNEALARSSAASRARSANWDCGRSRALRARARPTEHAERRLPALLAAPAAAQQRQRQPLRAEHARRSTQQLHGDQLRRRRVQRARSTNYGAQRARSSGEICKLPAGPLAVAFGVEARKEKLDADADRGARDGDITGYGGNDQVDVSRDRDAMAVFGEFEHPDRQDPRGNVAVRYDHYSDFGSTNNPKVSLRWQPTRDAAGARLVRHGLPRAVAVPALHAADRRACRRPALSDPIRCPVTHDTGLDCDTQFPSLFGGNPQLKPETSRAGRPFGFVFEPTPASSFSADYFKIRLSNAITNGVPISTILGRPDAIRLLVTRGPVRAGVSRACPGPSRTSSRPS